ncbi:hypothetical protein [Halocatena pleomorpha]|uniref:Acyl-CoA dehydrogenase n=1 Tax=Halocatena pleomorpha TaxID=1785090 RepID=A0A3P3R931_9EURY|nr:hypothetical protein [Halocatena pleomorpha]RRJ29971.1 hypothetical protein EIK79_11520 [Halocatena pleomorpha]
MPGMKTGTGDDPFADDPDPTEQEEQGIDTEDTANDDQDKETSDQKEVVSTDESEENETGEGLKQDDIPWVLRRERVKDGRPEMIPTYVRQETADAEPEFVRDVEKIVGRDVYKFDVREAAMLVAMEHPEEVAAQLNDWGYKYLD